MTPVMPSLAVELVCRFDRVLPGHSIGDEENFDRVQLLLGILQFGHQLIVDVEAPGGVDQGGHRAPYWWLRDARIGQDRAARFRLPRLRRSAGRYHARQPLNCSRAAGRYESTETTIGRCPFLDNQRASLPVEVVLPDPCRPTIRKTFGGLLAKRSLPVAAQDLDHFLVNDLTTCWEGESAVSTSRRWL